MCGQIWLRYQALWDLQPDQLYNRMGSSLDKWMATLEEIKLAVLLSGPSSSKGQNVFYSSQPILQNVI